MGYNMYRIVLADDEPLITKGLRAILDWEDYGFEIVYTAESGEDALSYIINHPIDILITDILMDEMSGLDLIREVKKLNPLVKCIVLTGYQEFRFIKEGLLLGIENYLLKPVDEEELLASIQNVGQKLNMIMFSSQQQEETTLLDNTLWNYLNGGIALHDCLERLSLYNFEFKDTSYSVSILNIEHYQDSYILKNVRNFIEWKYSALCLFSPFNEIVIIFKGNEEEGVLRQNQSLVDNLLEEQFGTGQFYLSMGKSINMFEELEDSFNSAREYSLLQLNLEPNVLISSKQAIDQQEDLKRQKEIKEHIVKKLMNTEEDFLMQIDHFFKDLTEKPNLISPQVVKKYAFDLICYIHYSIPHDDFSQYTAAVERMVYSTDIDHMSEILKEYCQGLLQSMNQHIYSRSPIVQNVLQHINAHYNEGLSLKTLGQQFHINAIYLGQLFQKEIGLVFSDYLNRYRLEKAKELLKTTHFRAGDIGKKVGYSDTTYFYKQFKKNVGTTPSEWRKI